MSKIPYGIRSVKIENFRGIDKLELDFTDPQGNPSDIIVIGGPNGCGKTAVLEACILTLGGGGLLQGSKGDAAVRTNSVETKIDIEVTNRVSDGCLDNLPLSYFHSYEGTFWSMNGRESSPQPQYLTTFSYFPSWRVPQLVGALPISNANNGKSHTSGDYFGGLPSIKQRLINLKAYNLMKDDKYKVLYDHERELRSLSQVWNRFYPHEDTTFLIGPAGMNPEDGFEVFYNRNEQKLSVDKLSAGQIELFMLFGGLLRTIPLHHSLVFIDEPELHLDPQWHATLLHELRRFLPQAQFIVATHSPQIFDSVYSYQRHFLVPESDPRAKAWKAPEKEPVLA